MSRPAWSAACTYAMAVAAVREQVRHQTHGRLGWVDVRAARRVLLQQVVLYGPGQRGGVETTLLRDELVQHQQDRSGRVDRHRGRHEIERNVLEQSMHVID